MAKELSIEYLKYAFPVLTFFGGIIVAYISTLRKEFQQNYELKVFYYTWTDRICEFLFHNDTTVESNEEAVKNIFTYNGSTFALDNYIPFEKILNVKDVDQFKIFIFNLKGSIDSNTSVCYGFTTKLSKINVIFFETFNLFKNFEIEFEDLYRRIKEDFYNISNYKLNNSEYKY